MRRISLIMTIVAVLTAISLTSVNSQRPRTSTQTPQVATRMTNEQRLQRTVTTQQRINRYFHNSVVPKLRNCWSRLQGQGTVAIEHTYTRDAGGRWVVDKLAVSNSTLPRGQDAVALQCMQEAVRATSFPVAGEDGDNKQYVVKWTWPVPFPPNLADQTRAMFAAKDGGSGTGCDGQGTPASCWDCVYQKDGIPKCKQVCEGYKECYYSSQDSCLNVYRCTTGGPTGVAGRGTIIY